MAEQTRKSTELNETGKPIDLDSAMKEITGDGAEQDAPTSPRGTLGGSGGEVAPTPASERVEGGQPETDIP